MNNFQSRAAVIPQNYRNGGILPCSKQDISNMYKKDVGFYWHIRCNSNAFWYFPYSMRFYSLIYYQFGEKALDDEIFENNKHLATLHAVLSLWHRTPAAVIYRFAKLDLKIVVANSLSIGGFYVNRYSFEYYLLEVSLILQWFFFRSGF